MNRSEKEFYGFETVKEIQWDKETESTYYNRDFYTKGMIQNRKEKIKVLEEGNETSELTGWNLGIIGGGITFASGTLYIMLKHGIGDLIEKYNKLDSASQKKFEHEIKEAKQIPPEIKNQIFSAIEEVEQ